MYYSKPKLLLLSLIFFLLLDPTVSHSQSIEFKITDCLAYQNDEVQLERTRNIREDCDEESLFLTFYPDSEIIELEIKVFGSGFYDKIVKMKPSSANSYKTVIEEEDKVADIKLNLNKLFGYIRGGEIEISGKDEEENFNQTIIKFERK